MKFHETPLNKEISAFFSYLFEKVNANQMSRAERSAIFRAGNRVFKDSGLPNGPDATPIAMRVFRQQLHVMKTKTIELCPHLADEVRNMSSGHSR